MVELHIFRGREFLTVDENLPVHNFQTLARKPHTALHIVLTPVDRAVNHIAERNLVVDNAVTPVHGNQRIIIRVRHLAHDRIPCREIEHHYVARFHIAHTFQTLVTYRRFVKIAFPKAERQLIVHQREINRGHGHTRPVNSLVYKQVIAGVKGFFER